MKDKEVWKPVTYKDIKRGLYKVSNKGRIIRIKDNKELHGCNPNNERGGYCRVCLKSEDGKHKKYPLHRIVLYEFMGLSDDHEVNHKNGKKLVNDVTNLESATRKENARHAAINNLYAYGEKHYRSNFTNEEVEKICELISNGTPISKVIQVLHLEDNYGDIYSNIDKIINGKSWKRISSKYVFDRRKYHYKTYSYQDIVSMCEMIFIKKMKTSDIADRFPWYKNRKALKQCIKSIKSGRLYKDISQIYIHSSTTIENMM